MDQVDSCTLGTQEGLHHTDVRADRGEYPADRLVDVFRRRGPGHPKKLDRAEKRATGHGQSSRRQVAKAGYLRAYVLCPVL